jgi:hypothetical protein
MRPRNNQPGDLIPTNLPCKPLSVLTVSFIDWSRPRKPLGGRPR